MLDPAPHSTDSASAARCWNHWPGGSQQPAQTKVARRIVIAAAWSLLAAPSLGAATANETAASNPPLAPNESGFPDKAITLLVGANPGGGWDQLARLMQHVLVTEDISPVPVEVINRGGAGGTIGLAELVTKHRRNANTVMIGGSTLASATISHGSRFSMLDTVPLARIISEYDVVAVPMDSPYRTMQELVERLRADPESVVWGGGSAASVDHILVGLIAEAAGVDPRSITYVAFAGGGEASAAVMGGQVTAGVSGLAEWKDLAEAGRIRLLAISSAERLDGIDLPTIRESGLDVVVENWRCLILPPGVRRSEQQWLLEALEVMRATDSWNELLAKYHWADSFLAGAEFEAFLRQELIDTAKILQDLGLGEGGRSHTAVGPYAFPAVTVTGVLLFGAVMGWQGIARRRKLRAGADDTRPSAGETSPGDSVSWRRFGAGAGASLAYILLLPLVGFVFITPVFLVIQSRIIGSRKIVRDIVVSVLLTAGAAAIFTYLLNVEIP